MYVHYAKRGREQSRTRAASRRRRGSRASAELVGVLLCVCAFASRGSGDSLRPRISRRHSCGAPTLNRIGSPPLRSSPTATTAPSQSSGRLIAGITSSSTPVRSPRDCARATRELASTIRAWAVSAPSRSTVLSVWLPTKRRGAGFSAKTFRRMRPGGDSTQAPATRANGAGSDRFTSTLPS